MPITAIGAAALVLVGVELPEKVERCATAARSFSPVAASVCKDTGPVELWGGDEPSLSQECRTAMHSGANLGRSGGLPPRMRSGLLQDFERKYALCQNPPPREQPRVRDTVKLWD